MHDTPRLIRLLEENWAKSLITRKGRYEAEWSEEDWGPWRGGGAEYFEKADIRRICLKKPEKIEIRNSKRQKFRQIC